MPHSTITLSSLYSSGQCLLSVIGSIGVILLFAGIPQLIYAPNLNPGSLMTFLLGALLISLMIAGNAFIGYKYRQLVRQRRTEQPSTSQRPSAVSVEDKPPSYDDLLSEEGLPPAYATVITEKPPRYDDLVAEVFNWQLISKASSSRNGQTSEAIPQTSGRSSSYPSEIPIIIPIQRHVSETSGSFSEIKTLFLSKFKGGAHPLQPNNELSKNDKQYNRSASFQQGTNDSYTDGTSKSFRPKCCITGSNSDGNLSSLYFINDDPFRRSPISTKNGRKKGTTVMENLFSNVDPSVHSQNSLNNVSRSTTNQVLPVHDSFNAENVTDNSSSVRSDSHDVSNASTSQISSSSVRVQITGSTSSSSSSGSSTPTENSDNLNIDNVSNMFGTENS